MDTFTERGAFITGGAAGFGLALAQGLHRRGMRVAIADIRADVLERAVASFTDGRDRVFPFHVDVADRVRMAAGADEAERALGKIHLLCNNAGLGVTGSIKDATFDDWDWLIGVQLGGVINGVQLFLPKLRRHGEGGHILNTASIAGAFRSGDAGIYITAKFGVVGLSEALRAELVPDKIDVSVFLAGPMDTDMMLSHQLRPADATTGYAAGDKRRERLATILRRTHNDLFMSPIEAARRVIAGLRRNDLYIITHPEFRAGLRDRSEALLRAVPDEPFPPQRAIPDLVTSSIYASQQQVPAFDPSDDT